MEPPYPGISKLCMGRKTENTKMALKRWAKTSLKNPSYKRREACNNLLDTQTEIDNTQIETNVLEKESHLQAQAFKEYRQEEEYWHLKSRSTWLKAGDRNTTYFHKQAKIRQSFNHIDQIQGQTGIIKGQDQIKEEAKNHYKELYTEEGGEDITMTNDLLENIPRLVMEEDNRAM